MKWPLVWRSSYDAMVKAWRDADDERTTETDRADRAERQERDATFWKSEYKTAVMRCVGLTIAEQRAKDAEADRIRAEVRAKEWEAIAMELIARGAGRPKVEGEARERSKVAEKIRAESGGDPALAGHFWKLARKMKAEGKTEDEIVGAIGWETTDPPEQVSA